MIDLLSQLFITLPQNVFAPMAGLLFVGGYKPDKSIFSVVTEDDTGVRTCHIFKWSAPVCR